MMSKVFHTSQCQTEKELLHKCWITGLSFSGITSEMLGVIFTTFLYDDSEQEVINDNTN